MSTELTVPSRHATVPERMAARSVIERVALAEGLEAMRTEGWEGAYHVLSHYAGAYGRLTASLAAEVITAEPEPEPTPSLVDPLEPDEPEVTEADEALAEAIVNGPEQAHYLVGKDGTVHTLVVDSLPANAEPPVVDSVDETAMEEGLRRARQDTSVVQFPSGGKSAAKPRTAKGRQPRPRGPRPPQAREG